MAATLALRATAAGTPVRKNTLARLFAAIMESRMRHAIIEIERHRHLIPVSEVERAGYRVTLSTDAELPFAR